MEIIVKHKGEISKAGKLIFDNLPLFTDVKNRMLGKRFELVLQEEKHEISVDSYAFYFGGVLKTAYSTNQYDWMNRSEDLHYQVFAPKFLSYEKATKTADGKIKIKPMIRDIKDLNQKEMNEFIERVIADLAEDGIKILDPSEYSIAKRYKTIK